MILNDVALVGGDTARTRCYMQAMAARQMLPASCIVLPSADGGKPGQVVSSQRTPPPTLSWTWGTFNPSISVEETCAGTGVPVLMAPDGDINAPHVVDMVRCGSFATCIYSGFGGVLLHREILACGKRFLHVHGGWLPDYKGSTTNHYSLLNDGFCGASAIFLTPDIDAGPILLRKKFSGLHYAAQLDYGWDSIFRADVLCDVLDFWVKRGEWPDTGIYNHPTQPYYIMHPVLRHILREQADKEKIDADHVANDR